MNPFALSGLLIMITCFGLFFVILRFGKTKIHKIWAIFNLVVAVWGLGTFLIGMADSPKSALFAWKIAVLGGVFLDVFFYHTVCIYGNLKRKKIIISTYAQSILTSIIVLTTELFFPGWRIFHDSLYYPATNIFYAIIFSIWTVIVVAGFYELFKICKESAGFRRIQAYYLFIGFLIGFIGGAVANFPVFGLNIYPFSNFGIPIYTIIVTYAILKYQLMDIKIVIQRALFYSVGISLASGGVVGISFLSNWFAQKIPGFNVWTVPIVTGSIAFIIGRIFWNKSKEVDKLKYEFITVAAHKLRTPLTEIKWGIEAAKDETNEKGLALLSEINNSASRLLVLSDELLSVSKTEASQYQYKFESADIGKLTEETVRDFRNKIKEKNIELVLNIKENLPEIKLDKMRISSAIQILLENAINYTKNKINITIIEDEKDVLFSIEDNGIGVKKEDIPYIFSQFYRTHEAYLAETEGSGIGLFLAKKIIEKHGGKIGVQSEGENKGSEFWFKLKYGT